MIIGLTGKNGAGKGEVARILKEAGFVYYSLSDVLREELARLKKPVTRESLTQFANDLRAQKGAGALATVVSTLLRSGSNYVIDSIRHPSEVEVLKDLENFYLVAVEASQQVRFDRIRNRNREADTLKLEDFVAQEARESAGKNPTDQQLNLTIDLADYRIDNSGTLDALQQQTVAALQVLAKKSLRPNWDDYFLGIAAQVSLRSNCVKRKVAAVIVKDQRVIATGYNGTPRGIKNCSEGGCPRCNRFGASGADLESCFCSHAEENAIVQAAFHGVSIQGATLYSTFSPCLSCTKMIINSGIQEVVYQIEYPLEGVVSTLLQEAHIKIRQLNS